MKNIIVIPKKNRSEKKKEFVKSQKDLLRQQYLSSETNIVISLDITQLFDNGELFCAIDLAGRVLVGHCFKEKHIDAQDVIQTMRQIIQDRSFLPKIKIIYSDRASHFKNLPYQQFVEGQGILISTASAGGKSNQVLERTFRTLKNKIRQLIDPQWSEKNTIKEQEPIKDHLYSPEKRASFITEAVTWYNNKPHKSLFDFSPNQMEEALFYANNKRKENGKDQQSSLVLHAGVVPALTKNEPGIDSLTVDQL